jgi:hypothetical protein
MIKPLLSHNFSLLFFIKEEDQVVELLKGRYSISILSSQVTSFNYNGATCTFFIKFALPSEYLDDFMFYVKSLVKFKLNFTANGCILHSEDFNICDITKSGTSMVYSDRAPVEFTIEGIYK